MEAVAPCQQIQHCSFLFSSSPLGINNCSKALGCWKQRVLKHEIIYNWSPIICENTFSQGKNTKANKPVKLILLHSI